MFSATPSPSGPAPKTPRKGIFLIYAVLNVKNDYFMSYFCLKMLNLSKNRCFLNFDVFSIKNTTKNLAILKSFDYI